jgi:hypothetical protein
MSLVAGNDLLFPQSFENNDIAVFKTPRQTDNLKVVHGFSLNALEIVKIYMK